MKTTLTLLFIGFLSAISFSQSSVEVGNPIIDTWVYAGNIEEAPEFLAGEKLTGFQIVAGDEKSVIYLGENSSPNYFVAKVQDNMISGMVEDGSDILNGADISTVSIKCVFDPATDAVFVTHGDHKLIFMRK